MTVFDKNELYWRVDEVLFYVWDPIGVGLTPYARGEYKSYVLRVLKLVEKNDKIEPISSFLAKVAGEYMEVTPDKERCDFTAELLLEHKKAIKEGYE